ncbi:hypothetical protein PInf_006307 [Phytophthora infestans]|nr:hypothetical protein PInf_006307 [Phytophthora infestans]
MGTKRVKVCWIGTLFLANKKTTNNVAENLGLYIGLKACAGKRFTPLEKTGRQPSGVQVVSKWHHRLQCYNKMADSLANLAMDTKRSVQVHFEGDSPPNLLRWVDTLNYMSGDLAHLQGRESALETSDKD